MDSLCLIMIIRNTKDTNKTIYSILKQTKSIGQLLIICDQSEFLYTYNNLKDKYKNKHQLLIKSLHKSNLMVRELWKPMHLLPMFKNLPHGKMINSTKSWKTGFSLPSSYYK